MTFREEILADGVRLICGDCREVLPTLGRFDAVVTDPPFEKEAHRTQRRTHKMIKSGVNADLDFDAITEDTRAFIANWGTNNSNGWNLYFCQAEAVAAWRDCIEDFGGKYKRAAIWIKPDSSPQFNGQMPAPGYESIVCQWAGQGHSRWNGGGRRGVFTHLTNNSDRHGVHPTEKPVSLMRELLELFTWKGDSIVDPFMGSGTTGIAAVKLGRDFTGVELEQHYFDIACRRISEALKQPDFFVERPAPAKQEKFEL